MFGFFCQEKSCTIWKWIQLFGKDTLFRRRRVTAFLVDETHIRIGRYEAWVWIAIEPIHRYILGVYLSYQRNIMVAELPCSDLERQNLPQEGADGRGMLQRAVNATKGVERVPQGHGFIPFLG